MVAAARGIDPAHAEPPANPPRFELTLSEAQRLADERHPAIRAARLEVDAARERVTQAGLRPNPELSVEAENFGGRNELKRFDGAEYTGEIGQTFELGGKRGKRLRVARADERLAAFDLAAQRLDVRAETARRFVDVLGAQERLALGRESLALAGEFERAVATRVQAGRAAPMELEKARVLLAQQQATLDGIERELHAARVRLSVMWGTWVPAFERVSGDLQELASTPEPAALAAHSASNPDLARWETELKQREAVLEEARAGRVPDVTVAGGMRRFAETGDDAFVAGVSIPLPVFDRNQGRVREAALLAEKAVQQRLAAEGEAAAALTEAHQALSGARLRIQALRQDVIPRSKAVFDAVQKGYVEGKFTYLDVLDARRTFFDARAEYVEALVAGHKARADVERSAGGLPPMLENQSKSHREE